MKTAVSLISLGNNNCQDGVICHQTTLSLRRYGLGTRLERIIIEAVPVRAYM